MEKIFRSLLTGLLLVHLLSPALPAYAGAWEQLQQIGGPPPDVPMPVNPPTPVDPPPDNSSYQDQGSTSSYNNNSSSDNSSSSSYSSSSDSSSTSSGSSSSYSHPSYDNSGNTGTGRVLWGLFDPPTPEELERQRIAREQRRIRRKQDAEKRRQQRVERQREEKRRERKMKQKEETTNQPTTVAAGASQAPFELFRGGHTIHASQPQASDQQCPSRHRSEDSSRVSSPHRHSA